MDTSGLDVLVIGAGTAGLAAAGALHAAGKQVVVVEARDRVGGRILTLRDPHSSIPIELGAEFIHGRSPELWNVFARSDSPLIEVQGEHWLRDGLGLHPMSDVGTDEVFEAMARSPEQSFGSFMKALSAPTEAKQAATGFVEGFNAARKEDVSVEWLNYENRKSKEIDGDRNFRSLGGYDIVPRSLAVGLDVRLSTPVHRVRWQPGQVVVETSSGEYRAKRIVIAAPLGVLRGGGIAIEPEPPSLRAAREAIITGQVVRVILRFHNPPWEVPQLSFIHGQASFPVWWTAYPVMSAMIVGWAAGPKADALLGLDVQEQKQVALESLRGILGSSVPEPEAFYAHDWNKDPFSCGAYSYVRTGGLQAQQSFREPVEDTLYFAGEATDVSGHLGTVHGALTSGLRAARQITGAAT